jgi:hypothetical protein
MRALKDAMAKERVNARGGFGCVKRSRAGRYIQRGKRGLRGGGNRLLRQWMRQRLERRIVFEREVRALVGFHEQ